jgi:Flp pilus assembly protein TadG
MVIWTMGLAVVLFAVIYLVTDAWRLIAADRALSAAVDAAAAAGANGIDEDAFRADATVRLDPGQAETLARQSLAEQPDADLYVDVAISATPDRITVAADRSVQLLLLRFIGESGRLVHAEGASTPRRSPP